MTDILGNLHLDLATAIVGGIAVGQALVIAFLVWRLIRRRLAEKGANRTAEILLLVALVFCSVELAAFVIGTYEGSSAFARSELGWTDWRQVIPWGALDSAAFGFGLLWIRAKLKNQSPVRPRRVVYITAGFSALVQMLQGGQLHHWQAGLFLAFLAIIGGLVLHTIADQMSDQEEVEDWRKFPPLGLRWFTDFPGTLCAWLAWINYPPREGTKVTVRAALDNLRRVRRAKRIAVASRLTLNLTFPRWTALWPWARRRILVAAVRAERAVAEQSTGALRAEHETALRKTAEQHQVEIAALRAEHDVQMKTLRSDYEAHAGRLTEQLNRSAAEVRTGAADAERTGRTVEHLRAQHAEQLRQVVAEHAEEITRLRTEHLAERGRWMAEQQERTSRPNGSTSRSGARTSKPTSAEQSTEARTGAARLTDDEAVQAMLRAHPEHDYDWGSREVRRITGAGFGRIEKLLALVAEHHVRSGAQGAPRESGAGPGDRSDDAKEQSA